MVTLAMARVDRAKPFLRRHVELFAAEALTLGKRLKNEQEFGSVTPRSNVSGSQSSTWLWKSVAPVAYRTFVRQLTSR